MRHRPMHLALHTSLVYGVAAAAWILLSDRVLDMVVTDPLLVNQLQTYKGWGFVIVTTLLLYSVLRREMGHVEQTTAELRERERKLSIVLELVPVGISILDADRVVSYVNPALEQIIDLPAARIAHQAHMTRRYLNAAGDPMPAEGFASAQAVQENRVVLNVETGIVREDGRVIWTNVSAVPVDFPDWHVVVVTVDITERKRIEQAHARAAARLQVLADASRAFAEVGADYQTLLDRVAQTIVAALADGCAIILLSDDQAWLYYAAITDTDPEIQAAMRTRLGQAALSIHGSTLSAQVFRSGEPLFLPIVDRDTDLASTTPMFRELALSLSIHSMLTVPMRVQGRSIGTVNLYRHRLEQPAFTADDLTLAQDLADRAALAIANARLVQQVQAQLAERTKAEADVRRLSVELEQRVIARTAALAAANTELEAFSYSISHDLRAPLRAINGYTRILLDEHTENLPDEAQRYFQLVRDNAQKMGHLIDALLAFARLSRQPLAMHTVDSTALVRQCLQELSAEQADRHVTICIGDLPTCQGDPALLKQAWFNLLANALKYTRHRDQAAIAITCQADGAETVFCVTDNGVGFDMRYSNKLFGVFQRLHSAEEYEGTGVGLAIVQRIIQRHGGRIWAEAELNTGAAFFFTVPSSLS